MIQITPTTRDPERARGEASAPTSRKLYSPAICDRLAITMICGDQSRPAPEPAAHGPNAFVVQENVVPQSGSALFM